MTRNYSKRVSRRSTYKSKKSIRKKKSIKKKTKKSKKSKKSKKKRGGNSNGLVTIPSEHTDPLLGVPKQPQNIQQSQVVEKPDENITNTAAKTANDIAAKVSDEVSDKVSKLGNYFNGFFQS